MKNDQQATMAATLDQTSLPETPQRWARWLLQNSLKKLSAGHLTLIDGGERSSFGVPGADLSATVTVHDSSCYRRIIFGGSIGAGEAYMDGLWDCDDLPSMIRLMVRNQSVQEGLEGGPARLAAFVQRLLHAKNDNNRRGSRRNIAAHYDLGNDFYQLFLDPTLAYSCGIFEGPDSTMEEASFAKFDTICRKLHLQAGMQVLEIGSGWGGFALHAARHYGCQVTTTTISQAQHHFAAERIRASGLAGQITLLQQDYRDLRGTFDRLVSIEMIEAVGHRHLPDFFRVCGERLKSDGWGLLQAITVPDHIYPRYVKTPDFINRYIFPGGCCPSLAAMARAAAATSDLRLIDCEDLTPHYVRTLKAWRQSFHANLNNVRALGYDERFIRMWDYYLAYCEGGFAEHFTGVMQLVYARPGAKPPSVSAPSGLPT